MLFALTGLLLLPSAHAFFRLPCNKPIIDARIDPIVSPGKYSGHAHTVMGGSNIGVSSTFEDLRASECSTCYVKDDKSAYWIPQLYYEFPNKTYAAVDHGGMLVYYLQRGAANETIQAFPDGLRMLAGNPYARSNANTLESQAISWLCLDYANAYTDQQPGIYKTACPDGLRAQVFFPGCWDGVNLDSSDHKSHMAYPAQMDNGQCPSSHPVHLISIFYEVYFSVDPWNKLNMGGRFVLANGDPTGYGLHADFMNGWDRSVLSRAVASCTNLSGVITDCGVFENEGRLYTDQETSSCTVAQTVAEKVDGSLPHLPGCVAVTDGPAAALATDLVPGCTAPGLTTVPASNTTSSSSSAAPAIPSSASVALPSSSGVRVVSAAPPPSSVPAVQPSVAPVPPSKAPAPSSVAPAQPSVAPAPPSLAPAPPSVAPAPPSSAPGPSSAPAVPPPVVPAPPSVAPAPPSVVPAPPSKAPAPPAYTPAAPSTSTEAANTQVHKGTSTVGHAAPAHSSKPARPVYTHPAHPEHHDPHSHPEPGQCRPRPPKAAHHRRRNAHKMRGDSDMA
ncbi:hypothetical protein BV25DRAFT_1594954 [Artomyces pyxidatus]|uniref:Uncharacterized protein n=1 Tax=Artomyces pyxidatus TaxID=48021 RepID=A0ACB8TBU5_9AGAM|nr:hypothetical protein BV25DRAFT_1594954 [Artomyces pyxidatus]